MPYSRSKKRCIGYVYKKHQSRKFGGEIIGFWSGLTMVVAAPFVVAACAASAAGAVVVGLPAAAAVLMIEEIENS